MIKLEMSHHLRLPKKGSKSGLAMNVAAKYAAKFCIKYIFLQIVSMFLIAIVKCQLHVWIR